MKERYISTIEFVDVYGKANKELFVECEYGFRPRVGDFVHAFKQEKGLEVELKDFINMTFVPIDRTKTSVISMRVIRTLKDFTYKG